MMIFEANLLDIEWYYSLSYSVSDSTPYVEQESIGQLMHNNTNRW